MNTNELNKALKAAINWVAEAELNGNADEIRYANLALARIRAALGL